MHIGHHDVERRLHQPERPCGEHGALVVEAGHQHADPLPHLAEHVLLRHFAILEDELAGLRAAHAELVEFLRDRESRERLLDDEGGDPARAGVGIGLGVDDERIRLRPVGDPELRAVQEEAVAALLGAELHGDDVGACARLRHRERTEMLARDELRQIARLLPGIAPAKDLVHAEIGVRAVGEADGTRGARNLLHGDAMLEIAEPRPAILLDDGDAVQAERAHLRPQLARKPVLAVDPLRDRRDPVGGEAGNALAQHVGGLAEAEIEGAGLLRSIFSLE